MALIEDTLDEAIRLARVVGWAFTLTIARGIQTVDASPFPSSQIKPGRIVDEAIRVARSAIPIYKLRVSVSDSINLARIIGWAYSQLVIDRPNLVDVPRAHRGIQVIEALRLNDQALTALKYRILLAEGLAFNDVIRRFFGAVSTDAFQVVDGLTRSYRPRTVQAEGIGLNDSATPKLVFKIVVSRGIGIDDAALLKFFFRPTVLDGVQIDAGYLSPGAETFTTWAINTRTAAVTEYTNYEFNGFFQLRNRYFATSSTGLYDLTGDTDNGAAIISAIKSGLIQFGGTKFAGFKNAYIALRGEGTYYLKLETGTGETYTYKIDARSQRTTKIHMGKGIRARYISYELTNSGQDFELDTLEFIPIVSQRRV